MLKRRTLATVCAALAAVMAGAPVMAQDKYPSRPINLVVPLTAGLTVDLLARMYGERMSKILGQPVVVINRPGAGGIIGTQAVAAAPADGYTLLMTNSAHTILPAINKSLPFDPLKDFRGVAIVADAPAVLIVSSSLGVNTMKEFVALAKAKPGSINYVSAGIGTSTHLAGAYFEKQAGIEMTHVPYKNNADIISDLLSGRVQANFAPPGYVQPLIKDGKMKALAVGSTTDLKEPFVVASARSQGVDYINTTWYGMLAPAKTPAAVLQVLDKAIQQVNNDPEVRDKLKQAGLWGSKISLDEFDTYLKKDAERIASLIKVSDNK